MSVIEQAVWRKADDLKRWFRLMIGTMKAVTRPVFWMEFALTLALATVVALAIWR